MSTTNVKKSNDENFHRMEKQKLMSSYLGAGKKAPLKTIQPTVDGNVGSPKGQTKKLIKILADKNPVKVFEDKKRVFLEMGVQTEREGQEAGTQTDVFSPEGADKPSVSEHDDSGIDQEAYDLMVKDPIPESYWRELAEERRLSLAEALSENEMLHQSIDELKEENLNLSQMAGQAEYLANVLNDLVGDDDDEDKKTEKEEEKTDNTSEPVEHESSDVEPDNSNNVCKDSDNAVNSEEPNDTDVISKLPDSERTDRDKKETEEPTKLQEETQVA